MKRFGTLVVVLALALCISVGFVIGYKEYFGFKVLTEPKVEEVYVVKAADSADGYATIYKTEEPLKILTLTDPQTKYPINNYETDYGGSNANTFVFIERLVEATDPDLVIVTGDIVMSQFVNNVVPTKQYLDMFERLGVYWAPTFGNHDCEEIYVSATPDADNLSIGQNGKEYIVDLMDDYAHCLMSAGDAGEGGGVGNYFINVREQSTNDIVYTMCIMDTVSDEANNAYFRKKTPEQIAWYERHIDAISDMQYGKDRGEEEVVKSMVFAHVPVPEIYDAYDLAFNDDGTPNENYVWGTKLEGSSSNKDYASCEFFESMVELKSTTAMFSGHMHNNDYRVKHEGIDLVFSQHSGVAHYYRMEADSDKKTIDMSDIFTYGDERGGDLITISSSTEYKIERILAKDAIKYDDIAIDYYAVKENLESRGWTVSGVPSK